MRKRQRGLGGLPIYARKGYWVCYVITRDGERRERALHIRVEGIPPSAACERAAIAAYWAEQTRATAGEDARRRKPTKTLGHALQALQREQELAELGPDAHNTTLYMGRNLVLHFGADRDLSTITTSEPLVAYAAWARAGEFDAVTGKWLRKPHSGPTVRMALEVLGKAMRAVGMTRPPMPRIPRTNKPQEPLTEEEQRRVLLAATPRHKLTILLLLTLGPRRGEIARIQDIDWQAQTMRIAGTKTAKSDRVVPIPQELFDHMLELRAAGKWQGFPRLSVWRIYALVRDTCKRAGIPVRHPNDFRGTASRRMRQAGVDAEVRGAIQGNSAAMQEKTYTQTHTLLDVMREAVDSTKRLTPPRAAKKGDTGT